jgi:hypothetical protein
MMETISFQHFFFGYRDFLLFVLVALSNPDQWIHDDAWCRWLERMKCWWRILLWLFSQQLWCGKISDIALTQFFLSLWLMMNVSSKRMLSNLVIVFFFVLIGDLVWNHISDRKVDDSNLWLVSFGSVNKLSNTCGPPSPWSGHDVCVYNMTTCYDSRSLKYFFHIRYDFNWPPV